MNHKKVANENHEESTRYTTRSFSRHGVPRSIKQEARIRNRAAKRYVDRLVMEEQLAEADAPPLPDDYEACGDCGYDHAYEYQEAVVAHGTS